MKKFLISLVIFLNCFNLLQAADSTDVRIANEWSQIITQQIATNKANETIGNLDGNNYHLNLTAEADTFFKTYYQNSGQTFWIDGDQPIDSKANSINTAILNQQANLGTTKYYVVTASIFKYADATSFEDNTPIDWAAEIKKKELAAQTLPKTDFNQAFFNGLCQKIKTLVAHQLTTQDYVVNYYFTVYTVTPDNKHTVSYQSFVGIGSNLSGLTLSSFDKDLNKDEKYISMTKYDWILKNLNSDISLIKTFKANGNSMVLVDNANRLRGQLSAEQLRFLTELYDGRKAIGNTDLSLKCQLFITSEDWPTYLEDKRTYEEYQPPKDKMMIWLHFPSGQQRPIVQAVRFGNSEHRTRFAEIFKKVDNAKKENERKYTGLSDTEIIQSEIMTILTTSHDKESGLTLGDFCAGVYSAMDWLSHGIDDHARIPEYVWKCEDPNYDPRYAKVFRYTIAPMLVFVNPAFAAAFMPGSLCGANPLTSCEFALMCGIWNGLIDAFKALPDGVKLLASAGSNDPKHRDWAMLQESVTAKGGGFTGFAKVVWEGLKTNHNFSQSPCLASHSVGSDIFNIVAAYFTAGGSAVGGTAARTFFTVLDKLDVLGLAVGKFASAAGTVGGFALKTTLTATGRTLTFIAPTTTKLVVNVATDAATQAKTVALKVAAAGAERLMNANDFVRKAVGATEREMFLFDPNFNPTKIVEVVKDGDGLPLKNTDGYTLAFAEDAAGNRQMVVLKEAQGIISAGIAQTLTKFRQLFNVNPTTGQVTHTFVEGGVSKTTPPFAEITGGKLKILEFKPSGTPYQRVAAIVDDVHYIDDVTGTDKIDNITIGIDGQGKAVCIRGACFVAGTLVHTAQGTKAIETIQIGDTVKSYDEKRGVVSLQRVAKVMQKVSSKLVRIITRKDTILATPEHPFYVGTDLPDGSKVGKWTSAIDMRKGLKVLMLSGLLATVENTFAFDTTATVYNFEVSETHDYFVGNQGILVHNTCRIVGLSDGVLELYNASGSLVNLRNHGLANAPHPVSGVLFDANGFPDFRPNVLGFSNSRPVFARFDPFELTGANSDFGLANDWLNNNRARILSDVNASNITVNGSNVTVTFSSGRQANYTWHHHQDAQTMMLVEQAVHGPTRHSGGRHVINHNNFILRSGGADTDPVGFVFYRSPY